MKNMNSFLPEKTKLKKKQIGWVKSEKTKAAIKKNNKKRQTETRERHLKPRILVKSLITKAKTEDCQKQYSSSKLLLIRFFHQTALPIS